MDMNVSRPLKFDHLDTIQYEIDMLLYCYEQLQKGSWPDQESYHLCIEGFLMHYRNLSEFFGSKKQLRANKPNVWARDRKLTADQVAGFCDETLDGKYNSPISRYLSHCNLIRADKDRDWNISEMFREMSPCLENFRKLFPVRRMAAMPVEMLMVENHSTSSLSQRTVLFIDSPKDEPPNK